MEALIDFNTHWATEHPTIALAISILLIWELVWKGFALWRAAKNSHRIMFVIILLFNTFGILPIVYLMCNRRKKSTDK
ncbi:MAG: DUF5652 family protein [Bacteroidales bacterium]|jgi:heme A synthase|nr:DUF5652 family protein [Bacteroidales bacterium]